MFEILYLLCYKGRIKFATAHAFVRIIYTHKYNHF